MQQKIQLGNNYFVEETFLDSKKNLCQRRRRF